MDFLTLTETMRTSFYPDNPVPSLGISDLNVAINAPLDYCPPSNVEVATLYFDLANCSRILPENAFQVRCSRQLGTHEFISWAEQGIELVRVAVTHPGLTGNDFADLRQLLRVCESRNLVLEIIPYEDSLEVPWECLKNFRFRNLLAVLMAANELLTLQMYADLGNAIEEINFDANYINVRATHHMQSHPVVMLLGELEAYLPARE
jgi:hypothetical protein